MKIVIPAILTDFLPPRRKILYLMGTFAFALTLGIFSLSAPAKAETITWSDPSQLATEPSEGNAGFFPENSLSGNTVIVNNTTQLDGSVYGGVTGVGDNRAITGNKLYVGGSTDITGGVSGGVGDGTVSDNRVEISDGSAEEVAGGLSMSGDAKGNTVIITGGDIAGGDGIAGGASLSFSGGGSATGNNVQFGGSATVDTSVLGGYVREGTGDALDNSVVVTGGTIGSGSAADQGVFGGIVFGTGNANNNSVSISAGNINGSVYGGAAFAGGDANNNNVVFGGSGLVNSDDAAGNVYGGFSMAGNANKNSIVIRGGHVAGDEDLGGGSVYGGFSMSGDVIENRVTVSDGTVDAGVSGGFSLGDGIASDNTVQVTGGEMLTIIGGMSMNGDAFHNSINMSGGLVNENIAVGLSMTGNVRGNTALISGGKVMDGVAGGLSFGANATDNSLTISGGEVSGPVLGGFLRGMSPTAHTGRAMNNWVTISGNPNLTNANLYGGYYEDMTSGSGSYTGGDLFTGNTLNVWEYEGTNVKSVSNFENYNFILPDSLPNGGTALTVEDAVLNDRGSRGSRITGASTSGGQNPLQVGNNYTLIKATNSLDAANFTQTKASGNHGATLLYSWDITTTGNSVESTLTGISAHPQAKALSEGRIASLSFANQGQDLLVGQGISRAVSSAGAANGLAAFTAVSGGKSRYNTGSHVDVDGASFLVGMSWGTDTTPGRLTLGAIFEGGIGNYDSHNSFNGFSSVKGDGDTNYLGGGILGRFDFNNTDSGNFYAEASGRMGRLKNDFSSSDLRDALGRKADYDTDGLYYGLHLGTGYVWNINEKANLDLYGKYLWTHQNGDSVTLSTKDHVSFADADSHRLRAGTRFSYTVNEYITPYIGVAYEQELDGKASATTYGHSISATDLQGGTGIGELGLSIAKPGKAVSFDLGVQGYAGVREGVTGSLQLKFEF